MLFTPEHHAELDLLMLYHSSSGLDGIKIHKEASANVQAAARRLFEAGFITQIDGGYLTPLGCEAADHAQSLFMMLDA